MLSPTPALHQILSSCHLEALVHGNLTADEARTLAQSAADALGPGCCMAVGERSRERCVSLPQGAELVHREKAKNAEEENAAIECYFQVRRGAAGARHAWPKSVERRGFDAGQGIQRTKTSPNLVVHPCHMW